MSGGRLAVKRARSGDYALLFTGNIQAGYSSTDAAVLVAEAYLEGKPRKRGKHKITRAERDAAFWSSGFLTTLQTDVWHMEPLVLALSRYMCQERVSNAALLEHVAAIAPETVRCAIRYSGLVLQKLTMLQGVHHHLHQ